MGFVAGTLVHTERGLVPIQAIQIGEKVLSKNEHTGEHTYQPVVSVMKTDNQPVVMIDMDFWIDPDLPIRIRIDQSREVEHKYNGIRPSVKLLTTVNHPVWVKDKGWIAVKDLTDKDLLMDKEGNSYSLMHPGYNADVRAFVYQTVNENIGYIPNYYSNVEGDFINLTTGETFESGSLESVCVDLPFNLYERDEDWEKDLRDQLGLDDDVEAEFEGFNEGYWVNPNELIKNKSDQKILATMTVYTLEVANTHTYFIGEYGILVKS